MRINGMSVKVGGKVQSPTHQYESRTFEFVIWAELAEEDDEAMAIKALTKMAYNNFRVAQGAYLGVEEAKLQKLWLGLPQDVREQLLATGSVPSQVSNP